MAFEGVTKSFKDVGVIKGIDLKIREGEFFTFVGSSGCGKSTLLNMIAGLESITERSIYFDDTVVNDLSPKDRDVAMVFQSYALYPHMTVYENIAFPLRMKRAAKSEIDGEVKVSIIESAGSFNYVDVIWNDVTVKGISKINDDFKAGSRVFIKIPPDKILLFDKKSGIRLGA